MQLMRRLLKQDSIHWYSPLAYFYKCGQEDLVVNNLKLLILISVINVHHLKKCANNWFEF